MTINVKEDIPVFLQMFALAVGLFGLCCPSPHDVATFTDAYRGERIKRTRRGELIAGSAVISTGALISYHSGNNRALYAGIIIVLALVAGYEKMFDEPLTKGVPGDVPSTTA